MRFFLGVLLFWSTTPIHAQQTLEFHPKTWVDTLCSPSFFGRGYEHQGCQKAAAFISKTLDNWNVAPLSGQRFQEFSFAVMQHEGEQDLVFNHQKLALGSEYTPHPSNGNVRGTGRLSRPMC